MAIPLQLSAAPLANWLAALATQCLLDEVRLTPKPGLVDARGNGAHRDLNLALMERSAYSLQPTFAALAAHSWQRPADVALRQTVGRLGREGEARMMSVTGGVNTHRGAIWALGLLISGAAMSGPCSDTRRIVEGAAALACLPDSKASRGFSNGQRASRRYRVAGAREEAQRGFPHVVALGLPQLRLSRQHGASETEARLDALLAIMSHLTDTCVLSRAGARGMATMQRGARQVIALGGTATGSGRAALAQLDCDMLALNASPGGAADLLAATLLLDAIETHRQN